MVIPASFTTTIALSRRARITLGAGAAGAAAVPLGLVAVEDAVVAFRRLARPDAQ
jgi:hypothetical protein